MSHADQIWPPALTVRLVTPFPEPWVPQLWAWMHEEPTANTDDDTPTTYAAFAPDVRDRLRSDRTWAVVVGEAPVGYIGYRSTSRRVGTFHGICFTRSACGCGVAREAVTRVLADLYASGVEKISATVFADNRRVRRFFQKLGATEEGTLVAQAVRRGLPIDLTVLALFNPAVALRKAG